MAKKEKAPKNILERVYNVPLRREYLKVANWKRTKKAVKALREFIVKHMKSENVILSNYVNKELWKHGIKNPPHHIKISAKKDEKGKVMVELAELPAKAKRELEKQKAADEKKEDKKKAEETSKKPEEKKEEKTPETKQDQAKVQEKQEIKELKKEIPKQAPKPMAAPKQVEQRPTAPKSQ